MTLYLDTQPNRSARRPRRPQPPAPTPQSFPYVDRDGVVLESLFVPVQRWRNFRFPAYMRPRPPNLCVRARRRRLRLRGAPQKGPLASAQHGLWALRYRDLCARRFRRPRAVPTSTILAKRGERTKRSHDGASLGLLLSALATVASPCAASRRLHGSSCSASSYGGALSSLPFGNDNGVAA